VIFVTGVHDEACEDDVLDKFNDYGKVRSINLNLDRQTGFAKGYALIEYATQREAEAAITGMNGQQLLGEEVRVTWTFITGSVSTSTEVRESGRGGGGSGGRRGGGGGSGGGGR
jgi:RNA-binding protein 8A